MQSESELFARVMGCGSTLRFLIPLIDRSLTNTIIPLSSSG